MSYLLLENISGPLSGYTPGEKCFAKNIKYGVKADVDLKISAKLGHTAGHRNGAVFTNIVTPIGNPTATLTEPFDNFSGYDASLLEETGHLDYDMIFASYKASGRFRLDEAANSASIACATGKENSVSILYNWLRIWALAGVDYNKLKFKPEDICYNDGHVTVSYGEHLSMSTIPTWLIDFENPIYSSGARTTHDFQSNVAIPVVTNLSGREVSMLVTAASAWHSTVPLRVAHSSPQLIDMIDIDNKHPIDITLKTMTKREVAIGLTKYVHANRLYSDFDRAYLMFAEIMYVPAPRSLEAHSWVLPSPNVTMPGWRTNRGLWHGYMGGAPFEPRPEAKYTFTNWCRDHNRIFMHAIAVTEAIYTGFFEILTAGEGDIFDNFAALGVTLIDGLTPYRQVLEACCYRFGLRQPIFWHDNYGTEHFSHLISTSPVTRDVHFSWVDNCVNDAYRHIVIEVDGLQRNRLLSPIVEAALFPCLSMGKNDSRFYVNGLHYSATLKPLQSANALVTTDSVAMNKALCMLRVAGYDATARSTADGIAVRNWAANSNGQVMPPFRPYGEDLQNYVMPIDSLHKRKMCWLDLPSFTGDVTFSIDIAINSYIVFHDGQLVKTVSRGFKFVSQGSGDSKLEQQHVTAVAVVTDPDKLKYSYTDFRIPEKHGPAVVVQPVLHLQESEPPPPTEEELTMAGEDALRHAAEGQEV